MTGKTWLGYVCKLTLRERRGIQYVTSWGLHFEGNTWPSGCLRCWGVMMIILSWGGGARWHWKLWSVCSSPVCVSGEMTDTKCAERMFHCCLVTASLLAAKTLKRISLITNNTVCFTPFCHTLEISHCLCERQCLGYTYISVSWEDDAFLKTRQVSVSAYL